MRRPTRDLLAAAVAAGAVWGASLGIHAWVPAAAGQLAEVSSPSGDVNIPVHTTHKPAATTTSTPKPLPTTTVAPTTTTTVPPTTTTVAPRPPATTVPSPPTTVSAPRPAAQAPIPDPASNIPPSPNFLAICDDSTYDDSPGCVSASLAAINAAHSASGIPAMSLPSDWTALSPSEQLFVATNLERESWGLAPIPVMAQELDAAAQSGSQDNSDPTLPAGFPYTRWVSNWGAGVGNPLEVLYLWVYDDGPGSSNTDCPAGGGSGCWGHRNNVLAPVVASSSAMGAGFAATGWDGRPAWAEIIVQTSGAPAVDLTWAQVTPYLGSGES